MVAKPHTQLLLLVAVLLLTTWSATGQTPFTGGKADGASSERLIAVSPCDPLGGSPYAGGGGSTGFADSVINQNCKPVFDSPYSGGSQDGFAFDKTEDADCVPTLYSIYSGGAQDGFAEAKIGDSDCKSVIIDPYSGGNHDGFADSRIGDSDCQSVIINPYSGGDHDGFAEAQIGDSDCKSVIIDPYSGGNHDGFSENAVIVSICTPIFDSPYSGGSDDGFAGDHIGDADCASLLLSIFSGGFQDGYAGDSIAASLGFDDPPPLLVGVCNNNAVVLDLPAGSGGRTYQWEVSTNGGTSFTAISNLAPYSGTTTNELTINPAIQTYDGYIYRVFVINPGCSSGYSPLSTLNVGAQPVTASVVKSPNSGEVCPGIDVSATFNGAAGGAGGIFDMYEYSTDGGVSWDDYTPDDPIGTGSLAGIDVVQIRTQRTTDGQGCINGDTVTGYWTVAGVGYWVGVTSSDWNTSSNWGCGTVPTITTDVTIPEVSQGNNQPNIMYSPDAYCRNLLIEPNASVTTYSGKILEIHGALTNNGIAQLGAGKVKFAGSTKQSIGGMSTSYFSYLEVNNSNVGIGLELNQSITVAEELILSNGVIELNGKDIDLENTGALVGESETSRVTGYPGEIKRTITMSSISTAYNDIGGMGISITTGASVTPGLTQINRGHYSYSLETNNRGIDRYFRIEPTINNNLDASMRIHYLDVELSSGSHLKPDLIPWRSEDNGDTWEGQFYPALLSRDNNANWVQQTNIPQFSIWTLSDWQQEPLPIELLYFNAFPDQDKVLLDWSTATEINSDYFTVERSQDAIHFIDILSKKAAGNSTTVKFYDDTDNNPLPGTSYYRLRLTDFDGSFKHSEMVPVSFDQNGSYMNVFTDGNQDFQILVRSVNSEPSIVHLFDMTGRLIVNQTVQLHKGQNTFRIYNPGLSTGIYMLEIFGIESNQSRSQKIFVK